MEKSTNWSLTTCLTCCWPLATIRRSSLEMSTVQPTILTRFTSFCSPTIGQGSSSWSGRRSDVPPMPGFMHRGKTERLKPTMVLGRAFNVDCLDISLRPAHQGHHQFSNPRVVEAHPETRHDFFCRRSSRPRRLPRPTL